MSLEIDSSRARRSYQALKELVLAIRDASDEGAEHHALEWKSSLDLSAKEGQFAVARAIIGMANRTVAGATRHFEGLGYIFVGVEVGAVLGTKKWDGADLEPLLAAYLGTDGPIWHHDNVDVDGLNVLVITVEAPRRGDRIHTLRKMFTSNVSKASGQDGDIFVRRHAQTQRAHTAEIRALEERLLSPTRQPRLELDLSTGENEPRVVLLDLSEDALDRMVEHELVAYEAQLEVSGKSMIPALNRPSDAAIQDYLRQWRSAAPDLFRDVVIRNSSAPRARVHVSNPGDEAIEKLQVKLTFPAGVEPYFEPIDRQMPRRPKGQGAGLFSSREFEPIRVSPPLRRSMLPNSPDVKQAPNGRWEIRYVSFDLHASEQVQLDDFVLIMAESAYPTEDPFEIDIRCTARNRSGVFDGRVPLFPTKGIPPHFFGLATHEEEAEDEKEDDVQAVGDDDKEI